MKYSCRIKRYNVKLLYSDTVLWHSLHYDIMQLFYKFKDVVYFQQVIACGICTYK